MYERKSCKSFRRKEDVLEIVIVERISYDMFIRRQILLQGK